MNMNMNMHPAHCPKKQGITDCGPEPLVQNISCSARQNKTFRTTLWTGSYLQVTLMCIPDEVGFEVHNDTDQLLRVESGSGMVCMGSAKDKLNCRVPIQKDSVIIVPAGTWHNIVNCGKMPLKLSSIYAPPHHPAGTVHCTRADDVE